MSTNKSNARSTAKQDRPSAPRAGVRFETLENRRLMSSVGSDPTDPGWDRSAYEFELGRPGERFTGMSATVFGADAATAAAMQASREPVLQAPLASAAVENEIVTGTYTPRLKFWGQTRVSEPFEHEGEANSQEASKQERYAGRPPNARPSSPPPPVRHHLLVVEDDPGSRIALTKILERRGWDVTAVGTLAEGMRELSHAPEAVILDLGLPDGDGETLLRRIHDQHLPMCVAVTTGTQDAERLKVLQQLGADAVLVKPVNVAALLQRLPHLPDTAHGA
ncbi:MAG: response regulator, partial [Tepidisphaeraceae bacterium]